MSKLDTLHTKAASYTALAEEAEAVWYAYRERTGYSLTIPVQDKLKATPSGRVFLTDLNDSVLRAERRFVMKARRYRKIADKTVAKIAKISFKDIPTSEERYAEDENNG